MGFIANSIAHTYDQSSGTDISATLPLAGVVGDVYVALATVGDGSAATNTLSSSNITWQFAENMDHDGNSQYFRVFVGRVHTAFSANSEVVTYDVAIAAFYRELTIVGYRAEEGYEFNASTYFEDATHVTYSAYAGITGANGYSTTPTLSGNGKHLMIGVAAMEIDAALSVLSPGTSPLTMIEDYEWAMFGSGTTFPGAFSHAIYDGGTNQAITCTLSQEASYMTSFAGIALLESPISSGGGPHTRNYSPDAMGMRTVLRM
jgi:hypothetical protein